MKYKVTTSYLIGAGDMSHDDEWLFDTREEAIYARLKKEKELCGEFGPNKDLFYFDGMYKGRLNPNLRISDGLFKNKIFRLF